MTKKEVNEDIRVDQNLLYQSPDTGKFYPDDIRRFSLGGSIPANVPLMNQDRKRSALTVLQEFKKKFRFRFMMPSIRWLKHFPHFFHDFVSSVEDGTLSELMPPTRSHEI